MHLEIVSPEQVLFSNTVDVVNVPGVNGEFQILNNHAPVVSVLQKGYIKLDQNTTIDPKFQDKFEKKEGKLCFPINGGVIELKDNKVIILVD
ncbi:MAG: F0F1 ATP synthase subunit epsilon [Flavobacteriaceae bacterium]|nr:F0F1 ATP synthase subunit epsilon [Flavobacteriaceae bacterium]